MTGQNISYPGVKTLDSWPLFSKLCCNRWIYEKHKKYSSCKKKKTELHLNIVKQMIWMLFPEAQQQFGSHWKDTTHPEKTFAARQHKQKLFHLLYFCFSFFMKGAVQRLCSCVHLHSLCGAEGKRQRDPTLCFLMKHFLRSQECPPALFFFSSAVLSSTSGIKQDVKKSDPGIKRCQDLWSRSISDLRKQPEWALNGGNTPLTT